jgi:hypothetical protein
VPDEPSLGYRIDELEPSHSPLAQAPLEPSSSGAQATPNPASTVDPSTTSDVERRDAGLGLSSHPFRRF